MNDELRKAAEKERPKALRLADDLEHPAGSSGVYRDKAAAELRRLHQSEKEAWRYADELEQERKRLTKAAEMALKRFDMYFVEHGNDDDFAALQALRQALAQPDLATVGEVGVWGHKREWVGLTKEEVLELFEKYSDRPFSLMLATHDKVKEKNT